MLHEHYFRMVSTQASDWRKTC
nr:unnamed protein product [Callosobruchus analis]